MDFVDKVIVITGASSGIGAATAIHLSKQSATLVLVGRKENNLKRIALYCEKAKGIKPYTIVADVTEDTGVQKIVSETIDNYGKVDVLVNNAGVMAMGGIKNSNMESFDTIMSTNIRAVYHLTMAFTPHLIKTKGCIVNVSSVLGQKATTMALAYNISKAALDHFTKCVALELAPDGVRINSVNPGYVKTNILKDTGLTDDQLEMVTKNIVSKNPLKQLVQPDDVANAIAYLASDKAKTITGTSIVIDAGSMLV